MSNLILDVTEDLNGDGKKYQIEIDHIVFDQIQKSKLKKILIIYRLDDFSDLLFKFLNDIVTKKSDNLDFFNEQWINLVLDELTHIINEFIEDSQKSPIVEKVNKILRNTVIKILYHKYISKCSHIPIKTGYITDFKLIAYLMTESNDTILEGNQKREYYIHSFVLDSDFFKALIANFSEKSFMIIVVNFQVIDDFLEYLYLKKINLDSDGKNRIQNLLKIADDFIIEDLIKYCQFLLNTTF